MMFIWRGGVAQEVGVELPLPQKFEHGNGEIVVCLLAIGLNK